jgi:hypothetical protein
MLKRLKPLWIEEQRVPYHKDILVYFSLVLKSSNVTYLLEANRWIFSAY